MVHSHLKIDRNPSFLFGGVSYDARLANAHRLCRVAHLCEKPEIIKTVLELLATKWSVSLRYAYAAMVIGDNYGLPCSAAYLHFARQSLERMTPVELQSQPAQWKEGQMDSRGKIYLSLLQHYRILHGQAKLGQAWHDLAGNNMSVMKALFSHATCHHAIQHTMVYFQSPCAETWLPIWQRALAAPSVVSLPSWDAIGRLKRVRAIMKEEVDSWRANRETVTPFDLRPCHCCRNRSCWSSIAQRFDGKIEWLSTNVLSEAFMLGTAV